jgi:mono/diheme cytochrome c family protein
MKTKGCAGAVAAMLLVPLAAVAQGQPSPAPSRGQLLYDNHCVACHNTQMHWRDKRQATDWASLKAQVRRWQAEARLGWSEDEIDDVARHLNDRIYRFPQGGRIAALPAPLR